MEIIEKEVYFNGEEKETSVTAFVEEINSLRNSHHLTLSPDSAAFLIMDMQNFFFDINSHAFIPSAPNIVNNIISIRNRCMELEIPVIYTRHVNTPENAGQMGRWWRDYITNEDPRSGIIEELTEPGMLIVEKSQYNAFYKTDMEQVLRKKKYLN